MRTRSVSGEMRPLAPTYSDKFELRCTYRPAIGVQSYMSWPCGHDSHPKPECHRRRILRYKARGMGHWF
jgi:hypothetical protein